MNGLTTQSLRGKGRVGVGVKWLMCVSLIAMLVAGDADPTNSYFEGLNCHRRFYALKRKERKFIIC
jgi:hypothetical protein